MLTDYIKIILPRAIVVRALAILAEIEDEHLDGFTLELERALDRDHHRVSLAAIVEVLGDLGQGDALRAIADRLAVGTEPIEVGGGLTLVAGSTGARSEAKDLALDRWDEWAMTVTGRASLDGVGRQGLRHEIATSLVGAHPTRRERDALLAAVEKSSGREMTATEAVAWVRARADG
jgi:hypothetical protein